MATTSVSASPGTLATVAPVRVVSWLVSCVAGTSGFIASAVLCVRVPADVATASMAAQSLRQKTSAGADFIITDFFFEADAFLGWKKDVMDAGINLPIIASVLPIQARVLLLCRFLLVLWSFSLLV